MGWYICSVDKDFICPYNLIITYERLVIMETLFLRILSLALSALMFVFNSVSAIFPGIFPADPVENNAYVCDGELFVFGESIVIDDYVSWISVNGNSVKEYDWKYFFTKSLAVVKVSLPDPGCTIEEIDVTENGNTLEVSYKIFSGDGEYASVICPKIIIIETSKNIELIDVTEEKVTPLPIEPDDPEIPEDPDEINSYGIYSADNFNDDYKYDRSNEVIDSYDKWYYYYNGSKNALYKYDREYFESKNLVVFYLSVPASDKTIKIYDISEDGKYLRVKYRVKNSEEGEEVYKGSCAVVIETSKSISYVSLTQIGSTRGYTFIDYTMLNPDCMPAKEPGSYEIVHTFESYKNAGIGSMVTNYYINNEFFEDTSLAVIYIMLPNSNHDVTVSSFKENGNTLEIEYTTEDLSYDQRCEIVEYVVMLAEISKNITKVKLTETGNNKNAFKTYDYFKAEGTEEGLVVSDYETWAEVSKTDYAPFEKYDEEYFKTRSVVLVSNALPDSGAYFDVIKVKENGNTLELVYGINGRGGLTMITYKTLLIEVSKNITEVSAQRKDLSHDYTILSSHNFNLSETEEDSAVLISDYETWQKYISSNPSSKLDKYDSEYFESNSVVLCNVLLYGGDYEAIARYLYSEGDTLYAGVNIHYIYGTGGITVLIPQTVVVEVTKDITQVEYEILR